MGQASGGAAGAGAAGPGGAEGAGNAGAASGNAGNEGLGGTGSGGDGGGDYGNGGLIQQAIQQIPIDPNRPFTDFEQAGLFGANEAHNLFQQGPITPYGGPQVAGFGNATNQAHNQIQNAATGNPYLAGATQQVSNMMTTENPFLQGFQGFSQQQNQHLDAIHQRGAEDLQNRMNSQFGASGRSGSGYHSLTQGRALGDYSANLYGTAYDNQQNRNLAALNGGSSAYQNQNTQRMQAAGMLPMLNDAKFDDMRMLQNVGNQQDTMNQLQLDDKVNAHNAAQNSGWANLNNFQNIVNGASSTQQPTTQGPDRNDAIDALSGLTTAAAIYYGNKRYGDKS